ncbi:MAG: FAD-dependent oxidoreductase [Clostridiales Family XIII bacterium]|jgi:fumarate reductase flavoprotein subunit|nr:FAD-dependent oxidoreductase [Clostridiales Family XIII bacterium]
MSGNVTEADIIIIGGGASGITAAVAAAEKGASVIVVEKGGATGGAANMGMGFFAVESEQQRNQLADVSVADAFKFFMEYTHWRSDARLVRRYFGQSADTVKWMESMGVSFLGAYKYFKESWQTWHVVKTQGSNAPAERAASNLYRVLTERAAESGVDIQYFTKAKEILTEDGHVTGVRIEKEDGEIIDAECSCVIVATGGFGDNPKMIKEYMGYEWGKDLYSFRIPGVTGDGLNMLWSAGAGRTAPVMELTYTTPGVTDVFKTISETMRQPNLMVNLDGFRFINEEIMNNTVYTGNAIARQRERTAFSIIDEGILDTYKKTGLDYVTVHHNIHSTDKWESEVKRYFSGEASESAGLSMLHDDAAKQPDYFFEADSLAELCEKTGIELANLRATMGAYNEAAYGEDTLFFKKHKYVKSFTGGKLYAAKHFPAGYGSLGGVAVNDLLEVLTPEGRKIPGLYACGTDACGIFGDSYCFYLPGNTMGFAVNSGRMAGMNAAAYLDSDEFE